MKGLSAMKIVYLKKNFYVYWNSVWLEGCEYLQVLMVGNNTDIDDHKTVVKINETCINDNKTENFEYEIALSKNKTNISDNEADICDKTTTIIGNTIDVYKNRIRNVGNKTNCWNKKLDNRNSETDTCSCKTFCSDTRIGNNVDKATKSVATKYTEPSGKCTLKSHRRVHADCCACPSLLGAPETILTNLGNVTTNYCVAAINFRSHDTALVTQSHHLKMGTSCSTNMYDSRDWSSIEKSSSCSTAAQAKRESFRNRAQSDPTYNATRFTSDACNCRLLTDNSRDDGQPVSPSYSSSRRSDKRTSVSSNETVDQPASRMSPNANNSFQSKLSRVVGSMRPRTKTNCDVSPQRLLTRRSNYPNYRGTNHDFRSTGTFSLGRQRSQSWSNGRLGSIDSFRPNPLLRTPVLYSVRNHKSSSSQTHGGSIASKYEVHQPGCPLYIKPKDSPKLSACKREHQFTGDLKDNWTPIQRRRAASESQTLRGRRPHRGEPDDSDSNNSQEHAHVHWADEEKGSALSTSVAPTSVRQRSYSHDGVGSSPSRPILKKVTGF